MERKGLSEVIVAVLLLLIVLTAVAIVWILIRPTIQEPGKDLEWISLSNEMKILDETVNVDNDIIDGQTSVSFTIKRVNEVGNMSGVKIQLKNEKGEAFVYNQYVILKLFEETYIYIDTTNKITDVTEISVAMIYISSSGDKDRTGPITDTHKSSGSGNNNPPSTPVCGDGIINQAGEVCDEGNTLDEGCGDGVVQSGTFCGFDCTFEITLSEECEPGLISETCDDLGYSSGTLACYPAEDAQECTFDISGCTDPVCTDEDGDDYGVCPECNIDHGCVADGDDCEDTDININPGADEICDDTIDNDCDGDVDCDDSDCVDDPACVVLECTTDDDCGLCEKCESDVCVDQLESEDTKNECVAGNCATGLCDGAGACDYSTAGTVCRASAGICDLAETCTGSSANCPTDSYEADGTICADASCNSLIFNFADTCQSGVCVDQGTQDCSLLADECNNAVCDAVTGCSKNPFADGTSCADGLFCNGDETCQGGSCQAGTPHVIDDGIICTDDSCDEDNDIIVNTPNNALCDDTLFCNGIETCDVILDCQAGTDVDCDDSVSCTDDSCNEGTDSCDNVANDANCDAFDLLAIATCINNPDNNPFTWDSFVGFDSTCNEVTDCSQGTVSLTHTCDVLTCGAECDATNPCSDKDCDYLDGCVGNDYYDYNNVIRTCLSDCSCEIDPVCDDYTVFEDDDICMGGDPTLVLNLNFDEGSGTTAGDSSQYTNDGTINGATWTTGQVNGALSFDGVDDYIEIADADSLDVSEFTILMWINPASASVPSTWAYLLHKGEDFDLAGGEWSYAVRFDDGTISNLDTALSTNGADVVEDLAEITTTQINEWQHIAVSFDGNEVVSYRNGVPQSTSFWNNPLYQGIGRMILGARWDSSEGVAKYFYDGAIDEVKVYNRALSEPEIVDDYGGTVPVCGNDIIETGEDCEPNIALPTDCIGLGYTSGSLACYPVGHAQECAYDTSGCVSGAVCGDGICEAGDGDCPADIGSCPDNICYEPTCIDGCGQTAVASGGNDEACITPDYCDGSGNCISAPVCTLTNAYWTPTGTVVEGTTATLTVEGTNCDGEQVNFEVREDDLFGGDDYPVTQPSNTVFSGTTATTTWIAEYQPDNGGLSDPPEYYFIASLISNPGETLSSSADLLVRQPQCNDGDDNDLDGEIDYPVDDGCSSASDDDETDAPPVPDPLVWLKFENDYADEMSNLDGSCVGGSCSFVSGYDGQAVAFTGIDGEHVELNQGDDSILAGMTEMTISVFARKNDAADGGRIIHKQSQFDIGVGGTTASATLCTDVCYSLSGTTSIIDDTAWHEYTLSYNGAEIKLFVDGVVVDSVSVTAGIAVVDSANTLWIGDYPWGDTIPVSRQPFDGDIDEFRFYDVSIIPPPPPECTTGQIRPCGVGVCAGLNEVCDATEHWPGCDLGSIPTYSLFEEKDALCNGIDCCTDGLDNDCDGDADLDDIGCQDVYTINAKVGMDTLFNAEEIMAYYGDAVQWQYDNDYFYNFGDGYDSTPTWDVWISWAGVYDHMYMAPGSYSALLRWDKNDGSPIEDYPISVNVVGEAPSNAFELWHADYQGRVSQFIIARLDNDPSADYDDAITLDISSHPTYKIRAEVSKDGGGYNEVLYTKNGNLETDEKFLLNNTKLPAGSYTLTVQILDSGDNVVEQIKEYFEKPYDGMPRVGINEYNAFVVDGQLFVPVTPWLLNYESIDSWAGNGIINTLNGLLSYSLEGSMGWHDYLDEAQLNNMMVIGPVRWEGCQYAPGVDSLYWPYSDWSSIPYYIDSTVGFSSHDALFAWNWWDEPELLGQSAISPATFRAWHYMGHTQDPGSLSYINLVGPNFRLTTPFKIQQVKTWSYLYNDYIFGKKTDPVNIISMDYYPIDWSSTMGAYSSILDTMQDYNYGLVPTMTFIETSNIDNCATPIPTGEQIKMESWLSIVHGVSGVSWFSSGGGCSSLTPSSSYPAMSEFVTQVNELAPIIYSAESDVSVTDDADEDGNRRVDFIVREDDTYLWIISVRSTDYHPVEETWNIDATFTIPDITNTVDVEVYYEGRTVTLSGSTFTDTFAPNDVHIYRIDKTGAGITGGVIAPLTGEVVGGGEYRGNILDELFGALKEFFIR